MKKHKKPFVYALDCNRNENLNIISGLKDKFPFITFFLYTGDSLPKKEDVTGFNFKFLEPCLELEQEKRVFDEYVDTRLCF